MLQEYYLMQPISNLYIIIYNLTDEICRIPKILGKGQKYKNPQIEYDQWKNVPLLKSIKEN